MRCNWAKLPESPTPPYAWRHGNGLARLVTLDTDGRVSKLETPTRHSLTYGWDTTDTIDSITDAFYSAHSSSFGYDDNDRLQSVTRSGDNQSFGWDKEATDPPTAAPAPASRP